MSENTKIEWATHSFNPWWGCIEVSPACDNCYARTFAKRTGHDVWGTAGETGRRFFADKHWNEPLKWNRDAEAAGTRARVFCASMADVFEQNDALDVHRHRLWELIEATPSLDWLLLTKRPQNIRRMVPAEWLSAPRHNVWYGTTVENQHYADQRILLLLTVPAVIHFISMEPLLGPVDLTLDPCFIWLKCRHGNLAEEPDTRIQPCGCWPDRPAINWVITGGESGHGSRPADPNWYRALRDECQRAAVPFHFKQWGDVNEYGVRVGKKVAGRLLDGRTWDEFPTPQTPARPAPAAAGMGGA